LHVGVLEGGLYSNGRKVIQIYRKEVIGKRSIQKNEEGTFKWETKRTDDIPKIASYIEFRSTQ